MNADMSKYDSKQVNNFSIPVPALYLVKVIDAKAVYTAAGNEMWPLILEIIEPGNEFFGNKIYENLVFTDPLMNRIKLAFESFEVAIKEGENEYQPKDIIGHIAKVQTQIEEYTNTRGQKRKKATVTFDGYFEAGIDQPEEVSAADKEIPF